MPNLANVDLRATAGELNDQEQFYIGQNDQNNDAAATAKEATTANASTTVTPATQAGTTPALNRRLFAGTGTPAPAQQITEVGAVLAALRGEVLACTGEKLRERIMWQQETGSAKKAEFMEDVVSGQAGHIEMFAFVQKGSTIVKVVHGVTRYLGRDAPELKRCVIGRVGEWTSTTTPHLVLMPANKSWEWRTTQICDDVTAWENYINAGGENKIKVFHPPAESQTKEVEAPIMALLPPPLAEYAHEKERTCYEMYLQTKKLGEDPNSGVTLQDVEFLMDFFMVCGQSEKGEHKHALQDGFKAVISVSPGFTKWTTMGMEAYLGQKPIPQVVSQHSPGVHFSDSTSIKQQATQSFQDKTGEQKQPSDEAKKKTDDSNMLSEYGMAALMGFCGVNNWREVPALYVVLQRVKDNGEARDIILEGMQQWQTDNGIEIHQNIFLPEDLIKNIRAIKPNPTKTFGTSRVSDVEFTNLVCLPLRAAEIEAKLIAEQAAASTEANRTKNEKEKQLKGESRNPPENYWGVKLNVATTAALVSVCYGEKNRLYANLMHIYEVLKEESVVQQSFAFTPLYCRQITWAIIEDMKSYFAKRLMPEQLKSGYIIFPKSKLSDIFSDIQFLRPIVRRTLPYSWRDTSPSGLSEGLGDGGVADNGTSKKKQGGKGGVNGGSGGGMPSAFSGYAMFGGQQQPGYIPPPPPPGPNPYMCPPVGTQLSHLHPKMLMFMQEYHSLVKKHHVNSILQRAGITQFDLPVLREHTNSQTGKSTLCWNYLTGECFFGTSCYFAAGHVPGSRLPAEFIDDAINHLKPGVEAIVKDLKNGKPKDGYKRPYGSTGSGGNPSPYGPAGDRANKRR